MPYRFIFYSAVTLVLIGAGYGLAPQEARHFLHEFELWRDPVLAGVSCGLMLSLLGVYILLNRIVFVSLALSQGASFGIFLSFWISSFLGLSLQDAHLPAKSLSLLSPNPPFSILEYFKSVFWSYSFFPLFCGLLIALATAVLFVWVRRNRKFPDESLIAVIYIGAAGLVILMGDRISEGKHEIENLLFGDAVAVSLSDFKLVTVLMGVILTLHFAFRREFLYSSADPELMHVRGFSPKRWTMLLYITLTVAITAALKVIGSLPVFALLVIPALIALKQARELKDAFLIALWIGGLVPALGYYFSFIFSLPTGASLIFVGVLYLLLSLAEKRILHLFCFTQKRISLDAF